MAEINLLKTTSVNSGDMIQKISGILVKFLALLAVGVVAWYGFLYFKLRTLNEKIVKTEELVVKSKQAALANPDRSRVFARQMQLKEFSDILKRHAVISKLLPAISKVTLNSAFYNRISLTPDGKVAMTVNVPTLQDFDKFLQIFDEPEVSKNFNTLRVAGYSKVQGEEGTFYRFTVQMNYNSELVKYK